MDTRILLDQICEIVKEAGELIRGCSSVGERPRREPLILLQNTIPWFRSF